MNLTKSKLHIAVLAALPLMAIISLNASADTQSFSNILTYPDQSPGGTASTTESYTGIRYDEAGDLSII